MRRQMVAVTCSASAIFSVVIEGSCLPNNRPSSKRSACIPSRQKCNTPTSSNNVATFAVLVVAMPKAPSSPPNSRNN